MPEEPVLLLSYVNTKLRDEYSSLDELAASEGSSAEAIESSLASIDYHYDSDLNQFK